MTISNIKELSRLIDLCRKKGIKSISIDNISIELGSIPLRISRKSNEPELAPTPEYSEEEILSWSVQGAG